MLLWFFLAFAAFGADLQLKYRSPIDNTEQPYRVYVPASYDAARPTPLVIAMHGTGGNESTLFTGEAYQKTPLKAVAEKYGVIILSPNGRGVTEYRGVGENDVFTVLAEVRKQYNIDEDRIYLTGHSMGGTGAAYLALHHPDLFAAAAPLAAAYSYPWLARNAEKLPFYWIAGAEDADYYHRGVAPGVERMRKFGVPVMHEAIPGEGHSGPVKDLDRVVAWLLKSKRDPHPRRYFFEADSPLHGCAWSICIEKFNAPGKIASILVESPGGNRVTLTATNVDEFTFEPDSTFLDTTRGIHIVVNGAVVWTAPLPVGRELRITAGWLAEAVPTKKRDYLAWRNHPVAKASAELNMLGTEKPLANWITDAMREATGADIAIWNGWAYRGLPIPEGTVDIVDLIQCSRPFDQYLVTVKLTGKEIADILDDNVPHPKKDQPSRIDTPGASRLAQISGAQYVFDPRQSDGHKIVSTDLVPDRIYTVALEGQAVERQSLLLAGRFMKLDYQTTGIPFTMALYGHAAKTGKIEAKVEGRVKEAGQ